MPNFYYASAVSGEEKCPICKKKIIDPQIPVSMFPKEIAGKIVITYEVRYHDTYNTEYLFENVWHKECYIAFQKYEEIRK